MDKKSLYDMAEAACMNVADKEEDLIISNINPILEYAQFNREYNDIEPTYVKTISYEELSEDIPKDSLSLDEVFLNTNSRKHSYFKIKEFVE